MNDLQKKFLLIGLTGLIVWLVMAYPSLKQENFIFSTISGLPFTYGDTYKIHDVPILIRFLSFTSFVFGTVGFFIYGNSKR